MPTAVIQVDTWVPRVVDDVGSIVAPWLKLFLLTSIRLLSLSSRESFPRRDRSIDLLQEGGEEAGECGGTADEE